MTKTEGFMPTSQTKPKVLKSAAPSEGLALWISWDPGPDLEISRVEVQK